MEELDGAMQSKQVERFELKRASLSERFFVAILYAAIVGLFSGMIHLIVRPEFIHAREWPSSLYVVAAGAAFAAAALAMLWMSPREGPPPIEVRSESILLPRNAFARGRKRIDVRSIRSITSARPLIRSMLILDLKGTFPIFIRASSLGSKSAVDRLARLLEDRMLELPDGPSRIRSLHRYQEVSRSVWSAPPRFTLVMCGVASLVWIAQLGSGSLSDTDLLLRQGAVVWWLVEAGDWHRLVTASLLHFHPWHFPANVVGLLVLGRSAEGALGSWRFAIVAMVSGLGTTVYVAGRSADIAVGLSGVIFGALGAIVVVNLARRSELAAPLRLNRFVVLNLVMSVAWVEFMLDWASTPLHLAGFGSGIVASLLLLPSLDLAKTTAAPPVWIRVSATVLTLFYVTGIARGFHDTITAGMLEIVERAMHSIHDSRFANEQLMFFGTFLLHSPGGRRENLARVANAIGQRDFGEDRDSAAGVEAALRFRLGQLDRAARLMREALRVDELEIFALRLAEIEQARVDSSQAGGSGSSSSPRVARVGSITADGGADALSIEASNRHPEGREIIVLLHGVEAPLGILRIVAAPGTPGAITLSGLDADLIAALDRSTPIVTSVEPGASPPHLHSPGAVYWRWWRFDPELDPLPRPLGAFAD
ncbi:MAG: rhomboid family intramembrane serine protease [Deltaproteobacteria bacterium]|nr:rhomboid family intramembrane serine protease [Deltaproteobacteria bacterium]